MSIAGERATVVEMEGATVAVHTTLRLCPGRHVNVRLGSGATTIAAMIASSWIHALRSDGPVYAVRLAFAAPIAEALGAQAMLT